MAEPSKSPEQEKELTGQVTTFNEAEQVIAKAVEGRPVYWYNIPKSIVVLSGITKVAIVENTAGEELMATNRAGGDQVKLGLELAKQALRFVGDTPVNMGDGSLERFWDKQSPGISKVRQLIIAAYMSIHNASVEEADSFLGSRRVEI